MEPVCLSVCLSDRWDCLPVWSLCLWLGFTRHFLDESGWEWREETDGHLSRRCALDEPRKLLIRVKWLTEGAEAVQAAQAVGQSVRGACVHRAFVSLAAALPPPD